MQCEDENELNTRETGSGEEKRRAKVSESWIAF